MRTRIALLCGAGALLIAGLPLMAQTEPAAPPEQAQHHEMPQPKNLQVLPKDITGTALIATMRGYSRALGVECGFCHAEDAQLHRLDFASDAKPDKAIARTMIRMADEINTKYLSTVQDPDATPADKTVTCGTCHRGNQMPAPFVASNTEHHSMPAKQ